MILSFLFSSFASPLTCKEVQEQSQKQPLHTIHRLIQKEPLQEDVVTCLQKKDLAHLIPSENADLISPEQFFAKIQTTKGDFLIEVQREWSPLGVDRFYTLIQKKILSRYPIFSCHTWFYGAVRTSFSTRSESILEAKTHTR